jgi:hypothetical protein
VSGSEAVHQLVHQVECGHAQGDPRLLLAAHTHEQRVETVGLRFPVTVKVSTEKNNFVV